MTYKNGIKEYAMATLFFGAPMGLAFGLTFQSAILGVRLGVFCGCGFALLAFAFVKIQEKKFDKNRIEIAKERKIICDGAATIQGNGGWLFFTEYGLEFYPHKINISRKKIMIPLNAIKLVKARKNKLVIYTKESSSLPIVVAHNKKWVEQINQYIKI